MHVNMQVRIIPKCSIKAYFYVKRVPFLRITGLIGNDHISEFAAPIQFLRKHIIDSNMCLSHETVWESSSRESIPKQTHPRSLAMHLTYWTSIGHFSNDNIHFGSWSLLNSGNFGILPSSRIILDCKANQPTSQPAKHGANFYSILT